MTLQKCGCRMSVTYGGQGGGRLDWREAREGVHAPLDPRLCLRHPQPSLPLSERCRAMPPRLNLAHGMYFVFLKECLKKIGVNNHNNNNNKPER